MGGGGGSGGSDTCDIAPLITKYQCSLSGCHDAMGTSANFDLASPNLEQRLVGKNPKGGGAVASLCATNGPYLAASTQPATGLFLAKLTPTPGCGVQMPNLGAKVSASDLPCFQKWANHAVMTTTPAGGGADAGGNTSDAGGQ